MAASWNCTSMLAPVKKDHPDVTVTSDASDGWVCGRLLGIYDVDHWHIIWESSNCLSSPWVAPQCSCQNYWDKLLDSDVAEEPAPLHCSWNQLDSQKALVILMSCTSSGVLHIECAYDFVVVSKHLPGKHNWCVVTQPSVNVFISVPAGLSTPHSSAIIHYSIEQDHHQRQLISKRCQRLKTRIEEEVSERTGVAVDQKTPEVLK